MSPLKKVGGTSYTSYQGMYGSTSSLPVTMVERIQDGRDVVRPIPVKIMDQSDFQTQVDMLTKAFTSEMARGDSRENLNYCTAMLTHNGMDEKTPDKLLDRRKKYNSMRSDLSKRSQLVSNYLTKYTKEKEKEKEKEREKERSTSAGVRRTKKYDHIPSKVDTNLLNLRKYTSLTSLDNIKANEQTTRTQSAIVTSKRTSSVDNLSAMHPRRACSARIADEYRYLKPVQRVKKLSQPSFSTGLSSPIHSYQTLSSPTPSTEKLNFYSAQFCRERLKKDKDSGFGVSRTPSLSRKHEDIKANVPYCNVNYSSGPNRVKKNDDVMSAELANIKASYEAMADKLLSNPLLTRHPITSFNVETIKSPRPVVTTTNSTIFSPTPLYSKPPEPYKAMGSGVRLASNSYYDRTRTMSGSLTDEYLKDVNNSINTYLGGGGRSSQLVYNPVNYKPPEPHSSGASKLYKSVSVDLKLDRLNDYTSNSNSINNNRFNKTSSMDYKNVIPSSSNKTSSMDFKSLLSNSSDKIASIDFKTVNPNSTEYNQLKETLCEASKRLGVPLPCVTKSSSGYVSQGTTSMAGGTTTTTSTSTIPTPSSLSREDSLRIHNWIDSLSRKDSLSRQDDVSSQEDKTKEEVSTFKRPLSGVWSEIGKESEEVRPTSSLLKSKWLSHSMPSDLNDDDKSVKSILKKKKRVRINLEFNKTYLL